MVFLNYTFKKSIYTQRLKLLRINASMYRSGFANMQTGLKRFQSVPQESGSNDYGCKVCVSASIRALLNSTPDYTEVKNRVAIYADDSVAMVSGVLHDASERCLR